MKAEYRAIINHKHFEPKRHPRMTREKRAAQFAPFAALTGYDKVLKNTIKISELRSRRVIEMEELDEPSQFFESEKSQSDKKGRVG